MSRDEALLGGLVRALSGECRYCHCHGETCKLPDGDLCIWADELQTRCNAEACQAAHGYANKYSRRPRKLKTKGRAA